MTAGFVAQRADRRIRSIISALITLALVATVAVGASSPPAAAARNVTASVSLVNSKSKDPSNAVIWLEPLSQRKRETPPAAQELVMRQKGKQLIPHVLVVQVGQQVNFPNQDPFAHNIFSSSEVKRFDLGIFQEGEVRSVLFTRPGVVVVHCNIHPQMEAFVVALKSPYYGISNKRGEVVIKNVPNGRYSLKVWHERALPEKLNALNRNVTIDETSESLGTIQIDEGSYTRKPHKNKEGKDYD